MEMTIEQYIKNPMGNAVMSNREMYRKMYMEKLDKLMVRESGKIKYKLYRSSSKYYAHIKVPSETIKDFYYDVVLEFSKPKDALPTNDLKKYNVKFFSNDPAFVYTFAHAFIKNDLFIKELSDKMSREAIKKKAEIKNPNNQVGYVKTLYFAYLMMIRKGLFNKMLYLEKYNEKILKADVEHADTKIAERQKGADIIAKRKKRDKEKLKQITSKDNKSVLSRSQQINLANTTNKIRDTKISKAVKTTNKTKTIKKTNTIRH